MGYGVSYEFTLFIETEGSDNTAKMIVDKIYDTIGRDSIYLSAANSKEISGRGSDSHWDEGDWYELFEYIEPYIQICSSAEFSGEDNTQWRYVRYDDGWYEEQAIVSYDSENKEKLHL